MEAGMSELLQVYALCVLRLCRKMFATLCYQGFLDASAGVLPIGVRGRARRACSGQADAAHPRAVGLGL
jgi:hypothetical protein